MSTPPRSIGEADLLAFADGRLAPQRAAEVAAFLAAHPEKAAEIAHWQRQNEALTALFPAAAAGPLPARLDPRQLSARPQRLGWAWPRAVAAALLLLAVGASAGWLGRDFLAPGPAQSFMQSAVAAHALYVRENRHAVEVAAAERDHLVTWLSNRLDRAITTPDLAAEGFTLVGGRLLPGEAASGAGGPAAQLMYENAAAERLTVYISATGATRGPAYESLTSDGVEAFYWSNDIITCTVVGELADADIAGVARRIYQQLTWRPDVTGT